MHSRRELNPRSRNGHGILSPPVSLVQYVCCECFVYYSSVRSIIFRHYTRENILPCPVRIQSADTPNSITTAAIQYVSSLLFFTFRIARKKLLFVIPYFLKNSSFTPLSAETVFQASAKWSDICWDWGDCMIWDYS